MSETGRPTDHLNLNLSKLHEDVVFGRSGGMIIWQPRMGAWLADHRWAGMPMGRYEGMATADIYRDLGCSHRPYDECNECFKTADAPGFGRENRWVDETKYVCTIDTPKGSISAVYRTTPTSRALLCEKRWIESPEDMKIATLALDSSDWTWDGETFDRLRREIGDLSAPTIFMPRVNVQDLYINTMGVEHAVYALYEWGTVVDDYFRALHENHLRMIEKINRSPIRIVNFADNLHCSTLSPALYEEYVLPAYLDRCERLHTAGKFVSSHWDGNVKRLLKYARTSGLDGVEAITPLPQGDVSLEEIRDALGDSIFLLDGIPAILFDEIFSEEHLAGVTERLIELFAPKLVLGISDEISATGDLERIRTVGRIVDDYNASLKGLPG